MCNKHTVVVNITLQMASRKVAQRAAIEIEQALKNAAEVAGMQIVGEVKLGMADDPAPTSPFFVGSAVKAAGFSLGSDPQKVEEISYLEYLRAQRDQSVGCQCGSETCSCHM